MRIKKLLSYGLLAVVALVVIAAALVFVFLNSIVRAGVEKGGSYALGVPTTLDRAKISLFKGDAALHGLSVANPDGFSDRGFFKADRIQVGVGIRELFDNEMHVREVLLDKPEINIESEGIRSNIGVFLGRLKQSEGERKKKEQEEKKPGRRMRIDLIRITEPRITVSANGRNYEVKMRELKMTNLHDSNGNGLPPEQILGQVIAMLGREAMTQAPGLEKALKDMDAYPAKWLDKEKGRLLDRLREKLD